MTQQIGAWIVLSTFTLCGCGRDWDEALEPSESTALCRDPLPGLDVVFHAELDSLEQVEKDGGHALNQPRFETGTVYVGLKDGLVFPASSVSVAQATLDFCYRPDFDSANTDTHALFRLRTKSSGATTNDGSLQLRLFTDTDGTRQLQLQISPHGNDPELLIDAPADALLSREWNRIRVSWDFSPPSSRASLNGAELTNAEVPSAGTPTTTGSEFVIGNIFEESSFSGARGNLDDFRIYSSAN